MLISDYLELTKTGRPAFAKQLGVTAETVRLWINGERTPRPAMMRKIAEMTGNKVTPADCIAPAMRPAA